jgi:hypothetical protein
MNQTSTIATHTQNKIGVNTTFRRVNFHCGFYHLTEARSEEGHFVQGRF